MSAALATFVHLYLAYHYYPVKFGFSSGPSICSINATFDCDAVAASSYSDFLGVPIALFGFATNLVIFLMVLGQWLGWTEHPERLRRWALLLMGLSLVASITMGIVSLRLHNYCLFCIAAYVLSVIMFVCYQPTLQEPFFANLGGDLASLWSESRGIVFALLAIPVIAFLSHRMSLEAYGVTEVGKIVKLSITEWQSTPKVELNVAPALASGPTREQAKLVISEFADFRCGHCKHAYPSLDKFSKTHPEVRLEFYNFPLDGECNEGIPDKSGISCRLAYSVMCAEKQGKGWDLHHALYDAQDAMNASEALALKSVDEEIKRVAERVSLDTTQLFQCMTDPAIADAVRLQAKAGVNAKIQGTPTIFFDWRVLNRGQLIPVMEAALATKK